MKTTIFILELIVKVLGVFMTIFFGLFKLILIIVTFGMIKFTF